jgi:GAF domain-containing protein
VPVELDTLTFGEGGLVRHIAIDGCRNGALVTVNRTATLGMLSEFAARNAVGYAIPDVLYDLTAQAVGLLDAAGAGISVVHDGTARALVATSQVTADLEQIQEESQQGPGMAAYQNRQVEAIADLADQQQRWPAFCTAASDRAVAAALATPLQLRSQPVGAFSLYAPRKREWSDQDIQAARAIADMAAAYLAHAPPPGHPRLDPDRRQHLLDARRLVEAAKATLAAERDIPVDDAFTLLRQHAKTQAASLTQVADGIVRLGLRP